MPFFGFPFFNQFQLFSVAGLFVIASMVVQVMFALGVKTDAEKRLILGRPALFVPPWTWALAVLVGGLPILLIYWLFHFAFERPSP